MEIVLFQKEEEGQLASLIFYEIKLNLLEFHLKELQLLEIELLASNASVKIILLTIL